MNGGVRPGELVASLAMVLVIYAMLFLFNVYFRNPCRVLVALLLAYELRKAELASVAQRDAGEAPPLKARLGRRRRRRHR